MKSVPAGGRLFAIALLVYSICPPFTSYDSYFVVPAALSILRHGTMAVDQYVPTTHPYSHYAVECVPPDSGAIPYELAGGCTGGHWYNHFTPGVPVLALLPIALIRAATGIFAALFPHAAALFPHPIIAAFLAGDLIGGRPIVELLCAALFGALAVWVQYAIAAHFLPSKYALGLALLFAFGTSEWSVASRNLSQHGLTVLLLGISIYLAILARERPRLIAWSAVPLALAFTVRPSNCVAVAVFTIYVAVHYRRELPRFLICASPVAAWFFAHNLLALHSLLPVYYGQKSTESHPEQLLAIYLLSPSRGLFIFTPVFLFSIAGVVLAIRGKWLYPLAAYLAVIPCFHAILASLYWSGHTYGPRYFSDMIPIFVLFLIPPLLYWRNLPRGAMRAITAGVFMLFAAWGVFVHARGATSTAANQWSALPMDVDYARWRVWDWHDPQFLRGLQ